MSDNLLLNEFYVDGTYSKVPGSALALGISYCQYALSNKTPRLRVTVVVLRMPSPMITSVRLC